MNKFNGIFIYLFILTGMSFLSGCVKGDFDTPEAPKVDFAENTSISQLIVMHTTGAFETITTDIIIKGTLVANDKGGNFYKVLYINDDSAGIEIAINKTDLYTNYVVGQVVYIKCKGLTLGENSGNLRLGYVSNGAFKELPANVLSEHIFLDSYPGTAPVPVSKADFTNYTASLNMLVKFDSVTFPEAGQPLCDPNEAYGTSRNILDKNGSTIILYTSSYASFGSSLLPSGKGCVTGIVIKYNTGYEFIIRDLNDLQGF